jgi:hypothetical protein
MNQAEEALRLATIIELADGRKRIGQNLGFSLINYGRLFVRDYWTLFAIAREIDCEMSDLLPRDDEKRQKRLKWSELTRASENILAKVRALPAPLRSVAEARGKGDSWRKICSRWPDRVPFSMKEDFGKVLEIVLREESDSVQFLTSNENIIVVKPLERA